MKVDAGGLDDWGKKIPYDEDLMKVVDEEEIHLAHPDWDVSGKEEAEETDAFDAMLEGLSTEELEALAKKVDVLSSGLLGVLDGAIAVLDGLDDVVTDLGEELDDLFDGLDDEMEE